MTEVKFLAQLDTGAQLKVGSSQYTWSCIKKMCHHLTLSIWIEIKARKMTVFTSSSWTISKNHLIP